MNREQRAQLSRHVVEAFRDTGWTQEELATRSGVPLRTISSLVRGERVPQDETLSALRKVLGIEPNPEAVVESWPKDVRLFIETLGLALVAMSEADRDRFMRDTLRGLIHPNNGPIGP